MGDHSRLLPTGLVLLLIFSVLLPFSQPHIAPELESESTLELVSTKSGGLIDVANWRIGDEWIYDSEFDVEELIQGGAAGSQVDILTGIDDANERRDLIYSDDFRRNMSSIGRYKESVSQCFECMRVCPVGRYRRKLK